MRLKKHLKKILLLGLVGVIVILVMNYYVKSQTNDLIYYDTNKVPSMNIGIIFGAGVNGDQPSKYLKDRLDAGIALYKSHKINKMLLSGDNGQKNYDELTVMKKYCYANGVDSTKIFLDYAGFDTYSTLYRAKEIFKISKAILVSQEYHLNRAIYVGNKLGVKSVGFSANVGVYRNYNYVNFRECLTVCKAVLDVTRGRKPHFSGTEININGPSNYSKDDKR